MKSRAFPVGSVTEYWVSKSLVLCFEDDRFGQSIESASSSGAATHIISLPCALCEESFMRKAEFDPGALFTAILIVLTVLWFAPIEPYSAWAKPGDIMHLLSH